MISLFFNWYHNITISLKSTLYSRLKLGQYCWVTLVSFWVASKSSEHSTWTKNICLDPKNTILEQLQRWLFYHCPPAVITKRNKSIITLPFHQIKHVLKFVQNVTFHYEERNKGQCSHYLFHILRNSPATHLIVEAILHLALQADALSPHEL